MQEEKSIEPTHPPLTRQGNFVKLWTGQSAALIGYEISEMALPLLAILVLDTDAGNSASSVRRAGCRSCSSRCGPASGSNGAGGYP